MAGKARHQPVDDCEADSGFKLVPEQTEPTDHRILKAGIISRKMKPRKRKSYPSSYYFSRKKRLFDVMTAILLLLSLSPIYLVISVLIKLTSRGPALFRQMRAGINGKPFVFYKFRTMYVGAEKDQSKLGKLNISPFPTFKAVDDPRFVGIGRWLSKTGLDELPQLINVIRGDMSMVGPRPFPIAEDEKLPDFWRFRTSVRPGIVSTWILSGRNFLTAKDWARYDHGDITSSDLVSDSKLLLYVSLYLFGWKKYPRLD